ncbi:G patch domain-containing protein 1 [Amphibalanus amphitrite]|uniref:G patch domain-containing protein 1 n=1 Tax=Amphibalanus amphitrite TaxID=1232801 RepID=A0A6A4WLF1_AMPAM|nr:G patch domain-containing protein 1 [Amphibalanus amphitrite]
MDSDSDDDNVHFGTPLEPLEEGSAAKRRPPALEDQTVRDSRGRQRFHGAFTGGFSAGFFNTVGSKDGFQPASFVSSRSTRAERRPARPDDFMDDEDRGEHGIAPQRVQARDEFRPTPPGGVKRSRPQFDEGPIPGEPVLSQLVQPVRDTVGVRILKAMGWRPGQGIGPRITKKEKKRQKKVYGCALPPGAEPTAAAPSDSDSDSDWDSALREVLLAPDDFEAPLVRPKHDHMGLGYRGLDRHSVLGAAAGDTTLRYRDKAGKVAIRGQAFGVGAFEDEDDDIYGTEDMSNYDFESAPEKPTSRPAPGSADRLARTLAGFRLSEGKRATRPRYPPPPLPPGFVPRHRARASRFEPRPEERRGLERHRLSAGRRAEMIGEQRPADPVDSSPAAARTESPSGAQSEAQPAAPVAAGLPGRPESERPSQPADSPAVKTEPGAVPADAERLREVHQLLAEGGDSPAAAAPALKPFASDPEKQARYEKFLKLQAANRKEDYHHLLPASMT